MTPCTKPIPDRGSVTDGFQTRPQRVQTTSPGFTGTGTTSGSEASCGPWRASGGILAGLLPKRVGEKETTEKAGGQQNDLHLHLAVCTKMSMRPHGNLHVSSHRYSPSSTLAAWTRTTVRRRRAHSGRTLRRVQAVHDLKADRG